MAAHSPCKSYATNANRVAQEDKIMAAITAWVKAHSMAEVLEAMSAARVPAGPILSTAELMQVGSCCYVTPLCKVPLS